MPRRKMVLDRKKIVHKHEPPAVVEILTNVRCKIIGLSDKSTRLIDEALAMDQPGSHFNPRVRSGMWDGKKHLFYVPTCTFPKGLLHRVEELLRQMKVPYTILDRRTLHPAPKMERLTPTCLKGITLRDYQVEAVRGALSNGCGILWLATNAGKTECASAIIKVLKERKCLFLVHKKGLLSQARERIAKRLGTIEEHIGVIGDGRFQPKHVTVAIINSLMRKGRRYEEAKKFLKSIELLIVDEGHHSKAGTWYRLINMCPAQYRYILSGTPFGSDNGLMVEAAVGPVVARVSNDELIALGVSARPTIEMVEIDEPQIESSDWDVVYKQGIVTNTMRNSKIASQCKKNHLQKKSTLVLIKELWHGDLIGTMLKAKGVHYEFVHGKMPLRLVEAAKRRFESGRNHVLIASPIFDEGVDVPAIRHLIIGDGGKSVRAILQKIGRGLRQKDGENVLDVTDFADLTHKWLSQHSLERIAIFEGEGFKVEM